MFGSALRPWAMVFSASQYVSLPSALTRSLGGVPSPTVHEKGSRKAPRRSVSEFASASPHARDPTVASSTTQGLSAAQAASRRSAKRSWPSRRGRSSSRRKCTSPTPTSCTS